MAVSAYLIGQFASLTSIAAGSHSITTKQQSLYVASQKEYVGGVLEELLGVTGFWGDNRSKPRLPNSWIMLLVNKLKVNHKSKKGCPSEQSTHSTYGVNGVFAVDQTNYDAFRAAWLADILGPSVFYICDWPMSGELMRYVVEWDEEVKSKEDIRPLTNVLNTFRLIQKDMERFLPSTNLGYWLCRSVPMPKKPEQPQGIWKQNFHLYFRNVWLTQEHCSIVANSNAQALGKPLSACIDTAWIKTGMRCIGAANRKDCPICTSSSSSSLSSTVCSKNIKNHQDKKANKKQEHKKNQKTEKKNRAPLSRCDYCENGKIDNLNDYQPFLYIEGDGSVNIELSKGIHEAWKAKNEELLLKVLDHLSIRNWYNKPESKFIIPAGETIKPTCATKKKRTKEDKKYDEAHSKPGGATWRKQIVLDKSSAEFIAIKKFVQSSRTMLPPEYRGIEIYKISKSLEYINPSTSSGPRARNKTFRSTFWINTSSKYCRNIKGDHRGKFTYFWIWNPQFIYVKCGCKCLEKSCLNAASESFPLDVVTASCLYPGMNCYASFHSPNLYPQMGMPDALALYSTYSVDPNKLTGKKKPTIGNVPEEDVQIPDRSDAREQTTEQEIAAIRAARKRKLFE